MRIVLLCLLTLSSAAWPRIATADPITIFLDGRQVVSVSLVRDNSGQDRENRRVVPVGGTATTQAISPQGHSASAVGSLFSDISDPLHMSGAGFGSSTVAVPPLNQIGLSETVSSPEFILGFLLDSPHRFDFTAVFTGTPTVIDGENVSTRGWTASLVGGSAAGSFNVFDHADRFAVGADSVREKGVLQPSEYGIFVEQVLVNEFHQPGSADTQGGFAFTLDLTPVPEPASFVLLGSGLIGLLGLRHQRT